jgi:hypothetical protein
VRPAHQQEREAVAALVLLEVSRPNARNIPDGVRQAEPGTDGDRRTLESSTYFGGRAGLRARLEEPFADARAFVGVLVDRAITPR